MSDLTPIKAIRKNCLECSGGLSNVVKWCPCDGVHSTRCHLWPYRFGMRPDSVRRKHGEMFVTPKLMQDSSISIEQLSRVTTA